MPRSSIVQGLWRGQKVAIKRVTIRTSADLDSFRQEVSLMAAAAHTHIVPLLAARALPPGGPPATHSPALDEDCRLRYNQSQRQGQGRTRQRGRHQPARG